MKTPELTEDMEWISTLVKYKSDGKLVCRIVGDCDNLKIAEEFYSMAVNLGLDVEGDRMLKLKEYLDMKKEIKLVAEVLAELVK